MGKKEDKEDFGVKLKMKGTRKDRLLANARGFIEEIKNVYDKWWG